MKHKPKRIVINTIKKPSVKKAVEKPNKKVRYTQ